MTDTTTETTRKGRTADRNFQTFNKMHQEVADYVNAHSGLDAVSPQQVKAVLLLRADFANSDEQKQLREAHKAEREAEKKVFEGLDPEDVKAIKAANRAKASLALAEARAAEALARAAELRTANEASGEDLAAAVGDAQGEAQSEGGERRRIRRGS
jgi:hypothetical protein